MNRLRDFLARTQTLDQQFSTEWKEEEQQQIELRRKEDEEKRKLEEAKRTYHMQIQDNVTKMYLDAFLPRFFDNELKDLETNVADKSYANSNRTWFLGIARHIVQVDHPVAIFGSRVINKEVQLDKDSSDTHARAVVANNIKNNPDAESFLNSLEFGALQRCESVAQRLNTCMDDDHYFKCNNYSVKSYNKATMQFNRSIRSGQP